MSYQALLLDFDGVLRQWPSDGGASERAHGLPAGSLMRTAFAADLLSQALTGRIDDAQWRAAVADRLRAAHPQADAAAAVAAWSRSCGQIDAGVLALLDRCRPGLRIVLVSNATTRLPADLSALGLSARFHAVVNSSEVGAAKPQAAIFHAALERAGVAAAQALFVDDDAADAVAAAALGMHALHYREGAVEVLRAWLSEAGALR